MLRRGGEGGAGSVSRSVNYICSIIPRYRCHSQHHYQRRYQYELIATCGGGGGEPEGEKGRGL